MTREIQKDLLTEITVIYAEDELPAREKLNHQLGLIPNIKILGFATTGKEAIELINLQRPDVVLLDIQMPEITGLELVDLLDYHPIIIYTTAYDQFAIQAFEKSSVDYLLKPFPIARLKSALDKAADKIYQQRLVVQAEKDDEQRKLFFKHNANKLNKLVSKNGERITLLTPSDLKFIKSEQGNSLAWNGEKYFYLSNTLDQLEQSLLGEQFVRVHRGYLVNIDHVKEIQRWFNGKYMIIINDNEKTELSSSRAGAEKLKALLGI